jgi:hypothetical protein
MWRSAACDRKNAPGQVDVQHLEPVVVGHLEHGLVDGDAGIVDEDVEPPVGGDDLLDRAAAIVRLAHIALVDADVGAIRRGEGIAKAPCRLVIARIARGQHGALAREASADPGADAAGASGDEGDAALQLVADANGDVVVLGDVENAHVSPLCPRSCGEGHSEDAIIPAVGSVATEGHSARASSASARYQATGG